MARLKLSKHELARQRRELARDHGRGLGAQQRAGREVAGVARRARGALRRIAEQVVVVGGRHDRQLADEA